MNIKLNASKVFFLFVSSNINVGTWINPFPGPLMSHKKLIQKGYKENLEKEEKQTMDQPSTKLRRWHFLTDFWRILRRV